MLLVNISTFVDLYYISHNYVLSVLVVNVIVNLDFFLFNR